MEGRDGLRGGMEWRDGRGGMGGERWMDGRDGREK